MTQAKQKSFGLAIAFIGLMFFAIGFAFGINGFLAGPLNALYGINKSLGYLVLGLSFLPFLLFAMPATATIKKNRLPKNNGSVVCFLRRIVRSVRLGS